MGTGSLHIRVRTDSVFLASTMPFEIRDARHRLVHRSEGSTRVDLPEGLYSILAVLPDGQRDSRVVQILTNDDQTLTLGEEESTQSESSRGMDYSGASIGGRFDTAETTEDRAFEGAFSADVILVDGKPVTVNVPVPPHARPRVILDEEHECETQEHSSRKWVFAPPAHGIASTPYAQFSIGGYPAIASLPLNPRDGYPRNSCTVQAFYTPSGVRLETTFHPDRSVAAAVQGLLRSGEVVRASRVIAEASELLLDKYQDPPGAALGGLTLHRLGRLDQRHGWVENLARDFPWIPDGRILLAGLLVRDPDPAERQRGYEALIAASMQRPLFTDGLSLMLDLLRRWPGDGTWDEREARLDALSTFVSRVDWNALALTDYGEEDQ